VSLKEPNNEERGEDPGVPEALPRTLVALRDRLGVERIDRLWIFPPLRRGRRERGLVAASLRVGDQERHLLVTAAYQAERTGRSLTVDQTLHEEGEAPPELLPRVMEGVVRRAGDGFGDPREVPVEGSPEAYVALLGEFDPALLLVESP
jgi:hypothetical protein